MPQNPEQHHSLALLSPYTAADCNLGFLCAWQVADICAVLGHPQPLVLLYAWRPGSSTGSPPALGPACQTPAHSNAWSLLKADDTSVKASASAAGTPSGRGESGGGGGQAAAQVDESAPKEKAAAVHVPGPAAAGDVAVDAADLAAGPVALDLLNDTAHVTPAESQPSFMDRLQVTSMKTCQSQDKEKLEPHLSNK